MRFEIFPDDLDVIVDFYTRVLLFRLAADQRDEPSPYVALQQGDVRIGAARRQSLMPCRPAAGVELVLEVDDVVAERGSGYRGGMAAHGGHPGPPAGLKDFRIPDPAGCYLPIADRAG